METATVSYKGESIIYDNIEGKWTWRAICCHDFSTIKRHIDARLAIEVDLPSECQFPDDGGLAALADFVKCLETQINSVRGDHSVLVRGNNENSAHCHELRERVEILERCLRALHGDEGQG